MGPAEIAHGPMFIGFTLNIFLYGIMITQIYLYYTSYKNDKIWMKLFVFVLLLADTANTIFDFAYLYRCLILHFGDVPYLATADWLFATDPAITGIIASLVQIFFAWRVGVLTRSWALAGVVFVGSLAGGAGAIATAIEVGRTPEFIKFQNFKEIECRDTVASLGEHHGYHHHSELGVALKRHKTGFQHSDLVVDRIIRMTVQTGLITSLVATLDLIVFLCNPTGLHLIFNFPLCKLYTNSLMSSLNSRRGWRYASGKAGSTMLQSEGNLGINTTEDFVQTPLTPNAIGSKHFRVSQQIPIMLREGVYPRNRTSLSLSRPPAALRIDQRAPEVFVHVESRRTVDENASTVESSPNFNGGMTLFGAKKQALSVCSSVDVNLDEKNDALRKDKECDPQTSSSDFGDGKEAV